MKYIILITLLISQLYSVPARGELRIFTQADGTTFKATAKGDQHLNWIESEDAKILKYNQQTKNYELAEIKNQNLLPSGQKYISPHASEAKKSQNLNTKKVDKKEVLKLWQKRQAEYIFKTKTVK